MRRIDIKFNSCYVIFDFVKISFVFVIDSLEFVFLIVDFFIFKMVDVFMKKVKDLIVKKDVIEKEIKEF